MELPMKIMGADGRRSAPMLHAAFCDGRLDGESDDGHGLFILRGGPTGPMSDSYENRVWRKLAPLIDRLFPGISD